MFGGTAEKVAATAGVRQRPGPRAVRAVTSTGTANNTGIWWTMRRSGHVGKAQCNPMPGYSTEQPHESLVTRTSSAFFTALFCLLQ